MESSKIRTLFTSVIVVLVVLIVGFAGFGKMFREEDGAGEVLDEVTRGEAPEEVFVPEPGSTNVPKNVAVPLISKPSLAGSEKHVRVVEIVAENNVFSPDTVIAYVGDTIKISMTAKGGDYDFRQPDYGLRQTIGAGETKGLEFSASAAGTFIFFCESCGGPARGPRGTIIVAER